MNLNTVYTNDFKEGSNERVQHINREKAEFSHRKMLNQKLPMESLTQHKIDFKSYDPEVFTSNSINQFAHIDLFKSKLNKSLNPKQEDDCGPTPRIAVSADKQSSDSNSAYRNSRNIVRI